MPSWGEILQELAAQQATNGMPDVDGTRKKYLERMHALTGRSVVLYSTDFLNKGGQQSQINLADMQGLMEVFRNLPGPDLDLIIHSPGGQAEATDRLVRYMRSKFANIRVFVPMAAMSAATMWAMAADELVMGKHSQVGPIDPQVTLPPGLQVPAGALVEQFQQAVEECAEAPEKITGWLPTLQQYPPGLLNMCESATALSKKLVAEWLKEYMLKGQDDVAQTLADWLASDKVHLSHGRAITREQLVEMGLPVTSLEDDQDLQDAVLSVHHATMHTFGGSAVKIIENHLGARFVQHINAMPVPVPQVSPANP